MNPQRNRRQQREPQRQSPQAAPSAADNLPRPFTGRPLPPRPMREILGDDEDLPTLSDTRIDYARRTPRVEPAGSFRSPATGMGNRSPARNSQAQPLKAAAVHRAKSGAPRSNPRSGLDPREFDNHLFGSAFERPMLRPQPNPLPARTPLIMLVISLVSIMILLSAFIGNGQSVWTRWFAGGGAVANTITSTEGSGTLAGARPPGNYELKAPPSIGPQQIDHILAEYGSPATGTGRIWYELGRRYGIDPVFAVAFFIHESGAGTSPAWAGLKPDGSTTHNVGNIICAGYPRCYGRFRDYASWQEGIEDWYRLIDVEYLQGRGHRTVADIIPVYAPSIENDVQNYVTVVHRLVDTWRSHEVR
jgi:hypothetical protein